MSKKMLPIILFTATAALGCVAAFADAQTKQDDLSTGKGSAAATSSTASCAQPECEDSSMHAHGMMKKHAMGGDECPLTQVASIADVRVENTKEGSTLRLVAKNVADVARVQELARDLTQHLAHHHAHTKRASMSGH